MRVPDATESAGRHLRDFARDLPEAQRLALHGLLQLGPAAPPAELPAPPAGLAAPPADEVLTPEEARLVARLAAEEPPASSALRPNIVLIMKGTRLCNLRCTYCNQWAAGPNQTMGFPVLARAVRDVLRAPGVRHVQFVWHGGESTLLPLDFYRKALWLQQRFARPGQVVRNAVQTNGTRLTDEWLDFLRRHEFSVGVSLDGPAEIHDRRRLDVAGRPTAARVRAGLASLRAAGIAHGVLLVVDDAVVDYGARPLLDHLIDLGITDVDFLNALPRNTAIGAPAEGLYLEWPRYVEFLRETFRYWWPELAGRLAIRELAGLVGQLAGGPPGTCVFAGNCFGAFLTVEPEGDVSACDKYVDDADYVFGNLFRADLSEIAASSRLAAVRESNAVQVDALRDCPWFSVCHGGCPHDRYTSLRRRPGADEGCCGFAPLLADMGEVVPR